MEFDFDRVFPAANTNSPMHKALKKLNIMEEDTVSYASAEMRFETMPEIINAVVEKAKQGYFAYSTDDEAFLPAAVGWLKRRHDWDVLPEEIVTTHGVMTAVGNAVRSFTKAGDGIIIQTPVYHHFAPQVLGNDRVLLENVLIRTDKGYEIDFEDFEAKARLDTTKMFILCSPHNPVGRVWTREELERMARICLENHVLIVSDEIHFDIILSGKHTVLSTLSPEVEQNCIVCTAPSKTFNIPGMSVSCIVIKNPELRKVFKANARVTEGIYLNTLGKAAAAAAYNCGDEWVDGMRRYVKENFDYFRQYTKERLPQVWMSELEGTYLAWLDFSYLGLSDDELAAFFKEKAKLDVSCLNRRFGTGGSQFVRVNIACPRRFITKFVDQVADTIRQELGK